MDITILSIFLGLGGMIGWGIYDFLGGVFAKQIGPYKSLFWSQLAGLLSLFILAFVLKSSFNTSMLILGLSAIAAVIYACGYLFFFQRFRDRKCIHCCGNHEPLGCFHYDLCLSLYGAAAYFQPNRGGNHDNLWRNAGIPELE